MTFFAQHANGLEQGRRIVKEVTDEDDQPTALQALREGFKHGGKGGVLAGLGLDHCLQDVMQMGDAGLIRNEVADLAVKGDQAHGILLGHEQVGHGCGELAGVVKLQHTLLSAISHATAGIEHDGGAQVGFLVELTNVEAVRASEDFPIQTPDIIPLHIGPVLAELDAESLMRRGVMPGRESLHHGAREELQVMQTRDVFGFEDGGEGGHFEKCLVLSF